MLLPRFIIKEMMHFEMGCLMNLSDAVTVVKGVGMRMKEKLERLREQDKNALKKRYQ